jgi:hypothetical protein
MMNIQYQKLETLYEKRWMQIYLRIGKYKPAGG